MQSTIETAARSLSVLSGRNGLQVDPEDPRSVAVKSFISARCERVTHGRESGKALLAAYGAWASENGMMQLTAKSLARGLMDLGFRSRKSNVTFWHGLRLRTVSKLPPSQKPGASNVG